MNSKEIFNKMKEENKIQEELLKQKIIEGNEALKNKLNKIKKDMEKISIYSHANYETIKNPPLIEDSTNNEQQVYHKKDIRGLKQINRPLYEEDKEANDLLAEADPEAEAEAEEGEGEEPFIQKEKREFTLNNQQSKEEVKGSSSRYNQSGQFSNTSSKAQQEYDQMQIKNKLLNETNKTNKSNENYPNERFARSNASNNTNKTNKSISNNNTAKSHSPTHHHQEKDNDLIKIKHNKPNELSNSSKLNQSKANSNAKYNQRQPIEKSKLPSDNQPSKVTSNKKPNQRPSPKKNSPNKGTQNQRHQNDPEEYDSDKENPEVYEQPILKDNQKAKKPLPVNQYNNSGNININDHLPEERYHNDISNHNSNLNDNNTKSSRSANFQGQYNNSNNNVSNNNTGNDFYSNYDNNNPNNQTNSYFNNNNNSQIQTGGGYYKLEEDDNISTKKVNKNPAEMGTGMMMNNYIDESQCDSSNNPTKNQFYNTNKSSKAGFQQNNNSNNNYAHNQNESSHDNSYMNEGRREMRVSNDANFYENRTGSPQQMTSKYSNQNKNKWYDDNSNNNNPSIGFGRSNPSPSTNTNAEMQKKVIEQSREISRLRNQIVKQSLQQGTKSKANQSNKTTSQSGTMQNKNKSHSKTRTKGEGGSNPNTQHYQSVYNRRKPRTTFGADEVEDYKLYEKNILDKIAKEEIYDDVGETKDVLGEFVDKVIERSLYLYKNRHCHFCAQLLSQGKSTHKCPKFHHKLQ